MAYGSGISAQVGFAEEVTYGTRIAPAKFVEFDAEGFKLNQARIESKSLRAGAIAQRSDRWASGPKDVEWSLDLQLQSKTLGLLFKHALGQISTATAQGGTTAKDHTAKLGDPFGLGLTFQVGRPSVDGTVRPFDYTGCKVTGLALAASVGQVPTLKLSGIGVDEKTDQTLATASYASAMEVLSWAGVTLTVGGTAYACQEFGLDVKHAFKTDRFNLGAVTRQQPIRNDFTEITGSISSELIDLVAYQRFVNGTTGALVAKFEGGILEAAVHTKVEVTLAYVRFDGETPNVSGPDVIAQPIQFKALDDGTADSPIKIVYTTMDATP